MSSTSILSPSDTQLIQLLTYLQMPTSTIYRVLQSNGVEISYGYVKVKAAEFRAMRAPLSHEEMLKALGSRLNTLVPHVPYAEKLINKYLPSTGEVAACSNTMATQE